MPDKSPEGGLNPVERITLSSEHSDRKRKLRKGTASCWECKHRKKRCTYQPASPAECDSCLRLGLTCVNQGLPDPTDHRYDKVRQRIVHVEALVEQLLRQRNRQSTQSSSTPNTGTKLPKPAILDHSSCPTLRSVGHERLSRGRSLTAYLESMFPNPAICAVILSSSKLFSSPLQIDQGPGNSQPVNYPGKDPIIPSNSHPLEFARRLVQLALCLKQFDAPSAQQFQKHLGEPVPIVAQRFSNVANHYVLSQDYLIASLEGIETLILQTRWYATVGNFRIACEIHRRATRIALSINILKLIETDYRAEKIWFHLVYSDRFLSLMLGIPSASTNDAFAHPSRLAINSPDEKMERIHTLLAGQLISRNLRIQEATSEQQKGSLILHEYKETKRIDDQLKKAARIMPTNWWRVQSLTNAASDREVLQRTSKLLLQMHQYFLLVALHQPYIVPLASTGYDSIDHTYSQLAATAACREMLLRFIIVRDYHRSPSYQALEGKAFTAAITLLFVHFNGHKLGHANFLAHQRPQDLDLVEQTVDLLDSLATSKRNLNCASQSQTLKQFMKIDQEAADGSLFITWNEQQITGKTKEDMNPQNCLRLPIPYFGIVSISPFESPENVPRSETPRLGLRASQEISILQKTGAGSTLSNMDDTMAWFNKWVNDDYIPESS